MPLTLSVTEDQIDLALWNFLTGIVPTGVPIVKAQQNRVAEPGAETFIVFTTSGRRQLSATTGTWDYADTAPTAIDVGNSVEMTYQLDIHGPGGSDICTTIGTVFRDQYGFEKLDPAGIIRPLYATEGRQAPFINGEKQWENRWTMNVVMQSHPVVSTPQEFAGTVGPVILRPVPIGG